MPVLSSPQWRVREKGIICIIGIEKIQGAEVKSVIAGTVARNALRGLYFSSELGSREH
jgi:hypothetical protein